MSVTIRQAGPGDAGFIAWIMLAAGRTHLPRGFWDQYVNGTEDECLAFIREVASTSRPHPFHHSIFILAEQDGRAVAGLSGYDPVTLGIDKYLESLPEVYAKVGWSEAEQAAAFGRIHSFLTCLPEDAPGALIVESVAALPEVRRQGVTSMLLEEMIKRAKAAGYQRAQISVFIGNTPAQAAYEKCGFRPVDEKRDPGFEDDYGCPGIRRLLLEL